MEDFMRAKLLVLPLCVYLSFAMLACNKPPANNGDNSNANNATDNNAPSANAPAEHREHKEAREEKKREPIVVPAGTSVDVVINNALGSKISQSGSTFSGSVANNIMAGNEVVIPKGAEVDGTVVDAKPLGKFAGGASLQVRIDSVTLNGKQLPVQANVRTYSAKGKGKRTAVMAGGGAALGGIIGALAGGGKGAAIGLAAGAGAGTGGAAFTGNKDIVLPAESDITFELSQPLEVRR
jgi:outer membrane lipoprotein SlyB